MRPEQGNDIIADGQRRILESEAYQEQARQIRVAVAAKYEAQLASAWMFERWLIGYKMEREIRRELQRLAPDQGLYLLVQK